MLYQHSVSNERGISLVSHQNYRVCFVNMVAFFGLIYLYFLVRSELTSKTTEIIQLQNSLEETESKLRLSQLALEAKQKVQNKADKIGM